MVLHGTTCRNVGGLLCSVASKTPRVAELLFLKERCELDLVPLSRVFHRQLTSLTFTQGVSSAARFPEALANLTSLQALNLSGRSCCCLDGTSLSKLKRLRSLDLSSCSPIPPLHLDLSALTRLVLADNGIGDRHFQSVDLSRLNHLDLGNNNLGAGALALIAASLRGSTVLRHLDLSSNRFQDRVGTKLAALLGETTGLHTLLLGNNRFGSEGLAIMAPALEKMVDLRVLDLEATCIVDRSDSRLPLSSFLSKMTNLVSLDLGHNYIDARGFEDLAPALSVLVLLQKISLQRNDLSRASAVQNLFPTFEKLLALRELNLGATWLNEESLEAAVPFARHLSGLQAIGLGEAVHHATERAGMLLGSILRHLKDLKKLDLGFNNFGRCLVHLIPSLEGMTGLRELILSGNRLGPQNGIAILAPALGKMTGLETLRLSMNGLGVDAMWPSLVHIANLDLGYNNICDDAKVSEEEDG
jgi:Leucine-rich repeat (LRR) protein